MSLPLASVSFLFGILFLQFLQHLPDAYWLGLLPAVVFFSLYLCNRALHNLFIASSGFLWALLAAHDYALHVLPESAAGGTVWVEGRIADIPKIDGSVQRFEFEVDHIEAIGLTRPPKKLRISWYRTTHRPKAGEDWRLLVKLKSPHGFMNPGGFDYEKWLYQRGIHATGYVKKHSANRMLSSSGGLSVMNLRQQIADNLLTRQSQFNGIWAALAVGYKGAIDQADWDILIRTGTNHLMAISGLHIGLIAGLSFWFSRRLMPLVLLKRYTADQMAAIVALGCSFTYALLAGFAIPTQRALIMLIVVLGAVILRKPVRPGQSLSLALLLVLIVDPLSVLAVGFWFSFLAVAVIAYSFNGRLGRESLFVQWGKLQWVIALALFPVSLLIFQQSSVIAPLANLLMVPWVSFTVVPLVLLSLLFIWVFPPVADFLLYLSDMSLSLIWPSLEYLANRQAAIWQQAIPDAAALLLALLGIAILLLPKGMPHRWLGLVMVLPGLFHQVERPEKNAFWLTLLDVGQGLSVFIQTQNHQLLFDAGARFGENFDVGDRVILPFFKSLKVSELDKLVVSHGDNDHKGGAQSVIDKIFVKEVLGQDLQGLAHKTTRLCQKGQHWQWDGVDFQILHPGKQYKKRNNRACVLRVSNEHYSLLIASDIERKVERLMLSDSAQILDSQVLIVPHHGSKTSSSSIWIQAVSPEFALISAGYRNRFGHPDQGVVERYQKEGIKLLNTASSGAISIKFPATLESLRPLSHRLEQASYWHNLPLR